MQLRPIDQPDGPKKELNYYHCVAYNIPFDLPMQHVVEVVTPNSETAAELIALRNLDGNGNGYTLVPHQLHVFKEKLPRKFASVTYFLQPFTAPKDDECCAAEKKADAEGADDEEKPATPIVVEEDKVSEAVMARRKQAHDLVIKYFTTPNSHSWNTSPVMEPSAAAAMANAGMKEVVFQLAQPTTVMNCVPFLGQLDTTLEMLKVAGQCADVKKLRTWVLTKAALTATDDDSASAHIGSVASSTITPVECAWLRTQHRAFPPQQEAAATPELVTAFFVKGLHPLFTFKDTVVV